MRRFHEETAPAPRPAYEIVEALSDEDREALRDWARLGSAGTVAAGGVGQSEEQRQAFHNGWKMLSPEARAAYHELLRALEVEYSAAREGYRNAYGAEPPHDVEAVMGPDWPGLPYLPADDLRLIES